MMKKLATAAALSLAMGTALSANAGTIYNGLAALAGPYESGFALAAHGGTAATQFTVPDGFGGVKWFGVPVAPPPLGPSCDVTCQFTWVSTHEAQVTLIGSAISGHKQLSWQPIAGGTVPCQPVTCEGAVVQQVENVTISE